MNISNSIYFLMKKNFKIQKTLLFFSLLATASFTFADMQVCETYFSTGIQARGPGNFVRFGYNAQLLNAYDSVNTETVFNHRWSIKKSCASTECTKSNSINVDMNPGPKLETAATNEFIIPPDKKLTIGSNNIVQYGKIVASERSVATFKKQPIPYVINQLEVGYKSKLRLPAGEYWVNKLKLEVEGRIDVVGEGQVTLYVIDSLSVPLNFRINDDTKNPAKMAIFTFGDSTFYTGTRTYAFVRSEGKINLGYRSMIVGGLLGNYVDLEPESQVTYDLAASRSVQFNNFCRAFPYPLDTVQPVFVLDQYDDITSQDHLVLTGTIVDSGENASGVGDTSIFIDDRGWVPFTLNGNSFSVNVPLHYGDNLFTFLIYDRAGNELFLPYTAYRLSPGEEF